MQLKSRLGKGLCDDAVVTAAVTILMISAFENREKWWPLSYQVSQ